MRRKVEGGGRKAEGGGDMKNQGMRDRTKNFALRVIRMYGALPKTTEAQVMGKQVLRSGTSVAANYREASGPMPSCDRNWESWSKSLTRRCFG